MYEYRCDERLKTKLWDLHPSLTLVVDEIWILTNEVHLTLTEWKSFPPHRVDKFLSTLDGVL
jgi:hypothetical protein